MSIDSAMLCERSRALTENREDVSLTPSDARRLIGICVDLIDLCAKVTGKIDPAVASMLAYARDEVGSGAIEIGS
jgi:hypothetical protein